MTNDPGKLKYCARYLALIILSCSVSAPVFSAAVTRGYVERGGQRVLSSITGTSIKAQRSYPGASVTVYQTGTLTLATIYEASDCVTAKANPFTADSTGYYEFCAAAATYDIRFSGSEISVPWTVTQVINEAITQTFPVADTQTLVKGSADVTKLVRMEADTYIATGQTRVVTVPNVDTILPVFSQPITFSGPSAARTITMPDAAITLINASQPFVFAGTSASRTITWPDAATSIPTISQLLTITGPTAPRTITIPDAAFTVARTDAANTFTGNQTITGHLLFSADATHDIGAVGATRPANAYLSGSLYAPTSLLSPIVDSNAASNLVFKRNGVTKLTLGASTATLEEALLFSADNTYDIGATGATRPASLFLGTGLWIGSAGSLLGASANILTLQNAANAQAFRIYGATTGPKYLDLSHDGTNAFAQSNSGIAYYGTSAGNSANAEIQYAGTSRLKVASDDVYAGGTVDLGRTANFRTAYLSTSVSSPLLFPPSGNPTFGDGADPTKRLAFVLSGITTGNTRVATPPDSNFTMARTDAAQTFSGIQTFASAIRQTSSGGISDTSFSTELITLSTSGTTTDSSGNMLPVNSIILAVGCRVITTITTATDWSVGDPTTAARFSSANATLVAGTSSVGLNHMKGSVTTEAAGPTQTANAKLRITTTGTPGAGAIRCTTHFIAFSAPTS